VISQWIDGVQESLSFLVFFNGHALLPSAAGMNLVPLRNTRSNAPAPTSSDVEGLSTPLGKRVSPPIIIEDASPYTFHLPPIVTSHGRFFFLLRQPARPKPCERKAIVLGGLIRFSRHLLKNTTRLYWAAPRGGKKRVFGVMQQSLGRFAIQPSKHPVQGPDATLAAEGI